MLRQIDLTIGEAAQALGVSADTLRRWDRAGKLRTTRDERNRRRVPRAEVERLRGRAGAASRPATAFSARNRFPGVVRSVEVDGVMALVEIEAGPHRVTAAITRDAVEELGLAEGVEATATVKATSVMVERELSARAARAALAALALAFAAGCGDDGDDEGDRRADRLRGLLARRRRSPPTRRSRSPDAEVKQSFAGSDELAAQIRQGLRPDVYAAADTELPRQLFEEGLVEKPRSSPATSW